MEITRNREKRSLHLSLKSYIEKVIERYGMTNLRPVSTPMMPNTRLSRTDCPTTSEEKGRMAAYPYASLVGSLMYAMVCCRPDICYAIGQLSKFMSNPSKPHWDA